MAIYDVRLTGRRQVAEGTMEFFIEKPVGFQYRAGQFFDIILPAATGAEKSSHVHGFSFASAPYEPRIAAATRMRDTPFKRAIGALPDGAPIKMEAVWGEFTLRKDASVPVVYIIGGIGVTPVRSMVAQATHDKTAHKLTLIFANRSPAYAPFVDDFKEFAQENPNFTFVQTYTDTPSSDPADERGRVDADMIARHVSDVKAPLYYMSGPPGMVRATREVLTAMGIDEDNIRTEEFDGY